jgi:GMP synthase-like glutamine amidotransferase
MYKKNVLITVQGHPEFNEDIVTEILHSRYKAGVFDDFTFEDAMQRVGKPHDGVVVAQAFLRFLLDD